jgi:adenylate cyclase
VESDNLAINSVVLRSDVDAFDAVVGDNDRAALESLAALYKGPFLDGFEIREEAFEEWLRHARTRYAQDAEQAFTSLAGLCESDGDHDAALAWLNRLLQIDPIREDAHRSAMRLLQQSQRWNDALAQYRQCVLILEAELGVTPQEETRALYEEILAQRDRPTEATATIVPQHATPRSHEEDGRPSIAILPFDSVGDDPDQGYFADGISEDIITELSRFPGLFVIARNSSFAYKDRTGELSNIQREFGVRYLVKGSVRKSGDRVRVTAQLIEAESGKNIWAERWDRELCDIFELQDELARGIVAVLPGRIEHSEARKVVRKRPEIMAAYELLLAGKIHHHRFTRADCVKALDLIDRAISLEPDYAAAYAWKGCVLGQAVGRGFLPDRKSLFRGAVETVSKALALDANEVEAHRIQAEIAIETHDNARAVRHNARALALNPNDPRLHAQKGELLTWLGEPAEGIDWVRMAMRLDPYSSSMWAHLLGRALMMAGQFDAAAAAFSDCAYPRFGYHADAAGCFANAGMTREAEAQAATVLDLKPDFAISDYVASLFYEQEADRARHREILSVAKLPENG